MMRDDAFFSDKMEKRSCTRRLFTLDSASLRRRERTRDYSLSQMADPRGGGGGLKTSSANTSKRENNKKKKYYAVASGRKPGVYETWDECKKQVFSFPNAQHKVYFPPSSPFVCPFPRANALLSDERISRI